MQKISFQRKGAKNAKSAKFKIFQGFFAAFAALRLCVGNLVFFSESLAFGQVTMASS